MMGAKRNPAHGENAVIANAGAATAHRRARHAHTPVHEAATTRATTTYQPLHSPGVRATSPTKIAPKSVDPAASTIAVQPAERHASGGGLRARSGGLIEG